MFFKQNHLKVHECIGEGLNATVYKASKWQPDLKTTHFFALKVLKRQDDLKHFKVEFENLLKARGRRLVHYRGWERFKSKPALLLELIEGVTLHELTQSSIISDDELSWIASETLAGLLELQESGLAHGDLSTKNIMIDKDGQIKLIDFGLTHWSTKRIELTPEFAAPTVLSGASPDMDSDVFSLKQILHSLKPDYKKGLSKSLTVAPSNLGSKVQSILTPKSPQTTPLLLKSSKKATVTHFLKAQSVIWASALFLAPVSIPNSLDKASPFKIRSSKWLSVSTSPTDDGCFTPCTLLLKENRLATLYWKSNKASGKIKIYTDSKNPMIHLKP